MSDLITYSFTADGLSAALTALGTTPDAVAQNLSSMGFRGELNEPLACPVANYLRASVEGATAACIGKDEDNDLFAQVERGRHVHVDVPIVPPPVAGFVAQFDAKLYPDLIEETR